MGWGDIRYCFAMAILVILIILPHIFVCSISRRCRDQTLMKFDERNQFFFISMATAAKFVLPTPIFLAYLVPLDVDVTGNITAKRSEVWSEFNIFCTLV
jgi:hypothetical protein